MHADILQALFAAASLAYLLASAWRERVTGDPLSAAPLAPSVILFLIYVGCLFLPHFSHYRWYRIAMGLAVLFFVGGVVLGLYRQHVGVSEDIDLG